MRIDMTPVAYGAIEVLACVPERGDPNAYHHELLGYTVSPPVIPPHAE